MFSLAIGRFSMPSRWEFSAREALSAWKFLVGWRLEQNVSVIKPETFAGVNVQYKYNRYRKIHTSYAQKLSYEVVYLKLTAAGNT